MVSSGIGKKNVCDSLIEPSIKVLNILNCCGLNREPTEVYPSGAALSCPHRVICGGVRTHQSLHMQYFNQGTLQACPVPAHFMRHMQLNPPPCITR